MTQNELRDILKRTGLPVAYRAFKKGSAPPLPFICFLAVTQNSFPADGIVYQHFDRYNVELYTGQKTEELETSMETVLTEAGICYEKYEAYVESEKVYQITYEIEV